MPKIRPWKETGVAKLVGSLFCFDFLICIVTFYAQLKETRDPKDSERVPSFQAVLSLFSSEKESLGGGGNNFISPRNK